LKALYIEIRNKFLNKVIEDVGLVVAVFDITSVGDAYVYPGDGASFVSVQFRAVVFRPFVGEIIVGKIKSSNEEGIKVSLEFFGDVFLPNHLLQHPSYFEEEEQLWYWEFSEHKLFFELESDVRLRIESIVFNKRHSKRPPKANLVPVEGQEQPEEEKLPPPMIVVGTTNESGLGCVQWWLPQKEEQS